MPVFIGDVHGKYRQYERLIERYPDTIQVGDMGVGFKRYVYHDDEDRYFPNPPHAKMVQHNARFIRGNHDNPGICKEQSQWIEDGHVEDGMMFIGGAVSIDRLYRREGYSWWDNEELSYDELDTLVLRYQLERPRIMVTHECPEYVANYMTDKIDVPSRTRQAFDSMHYHHQPELWVFGHWHQSFDQVLEGTRFVCLNELETRELE